MLRLLICLLSITSAHSFQVVPNVKNSRSRSLLTQRQPLQPQTLVDTTTASTATTTTTTTTSLTAQKNQNDEETSEKNSPIQLFFIYMNPFYNPNSIFVYMFAILYCLGKYSESKHIVESTVMWDLPWPRFTDRFIGWCVLLWKFLAKRGSAKGLRLWNTDWRIEKWSTWENACEKEYSAAHVEKSGLHLTSNNEE